MTLIESIRKGVQSVFCSLLYPYLTHTQRNRFKVKLTCLKVQYNVYTALIYQTFIIKLFAQVGKMTHTHIHTHTRFVYVNYSNQAHTLQLRLQGVLLVKNFVSLDSLEYKFCLQYYVTSRSHNATNNDLHLLESQLRNEVHRLSAKSHTTSIRKKQTSDTHIRYDAKTGKRVQQDKPRRRTKRKTVQVAQASVGK